MTDTALRIALDAAGLDWIVPDWPAPPNVHALSTSRHGVNGQPIDLSPLRSDRAAQRATLSTFLPSPPLWLSQQHGVAVVDADRQYDDVPRADGAVARRPGSVCVVLSADCMPMLFTDRSGSVVAAAHAGWRGLAAGVVEAALSALDMAPRDVLVWLGPAIGPSAFEVGDDVFNAFCDKDSGAAACFTVQRPGKWQANLYALARRRLGHAGVTAIYGGDRCTYTERDRFYSYRRGGADAGGRMATLIWRSAVERRD